MSDKVNKYKYYPKNPRKLKLKTVLHKLRDYRLLFIFSIPLYIMWGCFALACIALSFTYELMTKRDYIEMATSFIALILSGLVIVGIYFLIFAVKKATDSRAAVTNTKKYLQISDSFVEEVENDLAKGMPFLKSHNLGISENYIFGNLTLINFTPVIIPKNEIVEVVYEIFEGASTLVAHNGHVMNARNFYQNFFFRLKNGNYVPVQVNDKFKLDIALAALQNAGLKTIELNRNAAENLLRSKNNRNTYIIQPERIIVRNLDVTKIIPLPVSDCCIRFEELSYGPDGNLCVTAICKDDGKIKYFIDERSVTIVAKQVIIAPQPKTAEAPKETGRSIMTREKFFELCNDVCDWDKSGDDELVLKPLVEYLAKLSDEDIFAFEDIMSELLYEIDTKQNYETALKYDTHNDDTFLYSRCIAIVNGKDYFDKVKNGKIKDIWKMEFEAILYVARDAWAKKHGKSAKDFPHISSVSYETGSNKDGWK
jgi:hypothetical protein